VSSFGDDSEHRRRRWPTLTVGGRAFVGVAAVRSLHTGASRLSPLASILLRRQTLVQRDEEPPRDKVRPNADKDVDVLSQLHQHKHLSRRERRDAQCAPCSHVGERELPPSAIASLRAAPNAIFRPSRFHIEGPPGNDACEAVAAGL
jgi:hypothetical protein